MRYYRVDTSRLHLGECWRLAPGFGFLVLAGMKLFGASLPATMAIAETRELDLVDPRELPFQATAAFDRVLSPLLEPRGPFGSLFYYRGPSLMQGVGLAAVARSRDGRTVAQALYVHMPPREQCALGLLSRLPDGTVVMTLAKKRELDGPPQNRARYLPTASPEELWAAHGRHLQGLPPAEALAADDVPSLVLDNERRSLEWNVKRGVYRPMSFEEVLELRGRLGLGGGEADYTASGGT